MVQTMGPSRRNGPGIDDLKVTAMDLAQVESSALDRWLACLRQSPRGKNQACAR